MKPRHMFRNIVLSLLTLALIGTQMIIYAAEAETAKNLEQGSLIYEKVRGSEEIETSKTKTSETETSDTESTVRDPFFKGTLPLRNSVTKELIQNLSVTVKALGVNDAVLGSFEYTLNGSINLNEIADKLTGFDLSQTKKIQIFSNETRDFNVLAGYMQPGDVVNFWDLKKYEKLIVKQYIRDMNSKVNVSGLKLKLNYYNTKSGSKDLIVSIPTTTNDSKNDYNFDETLTDIYRDRENANYVELVLDETLENPIDRGSGSMTPVKPVNLTIIADGGTFKDGSQELVIRGFKDEPLDVDYEKYEEPTHPDGAFKFWTITGISAWNMDEKIGTSKIFRAKYDHEIFTVNFDTKGGSTVDPIKDVFKGTYIKKPNDPQLDEHDFMGWYLDQDFSQAWDFENDIVEKNMTLYAKWTQAWTPIDVYHSVSIEPNNGEAQTTLSIKEGEIITGLSDPSYADHEFSGWYRDAAFTQKWDLNTDTVTEDVTLYAKWTQAWTPIDVYHSVTIEPNNGEVQTTLSIKESEVITGLSDPSYADHEFAGWYRDAAFTQKWELNTDTVTEDMTLYAKWTQAWTPIDVYHSVTIEPNNGEVQTTLSIKEGEVITGLSDPSYADHEFAGWYRDAAFTQKWDLNTDTVTEDMTLYAKWTQAWTPIDVTHTVTIDPKNGEAVITHTVKDGDLISIPEEPTLEGKQFVGWYRDTMLTIPWDFEKDTVTEDITLTAKWKTGSTPSDVYHLITFYTYGGTNISPIRVLDNQTIQKPNDPVKEGYRFVDWFSDEAMTDKWDFTTTITADTSLYAKWERVDEIGGNETNPGVDDDNGGSAGHENKKPIENTKNNENKSQTDLPATGMNNITVISMGIAVMLLGMIVVLLQKIKRHMNNI